MMTLESLHEKYGDTTIVVVPASTFDGMDEWTPKDKVDVLMDYMNYPRYKAELDPAYRQIVAYIVIRNTEGKYFVTRRKGGDERLMGNLACVGGHMESEFGDEAIVDTAWRELNEECQLSDFAFKNCTFHPVGWIVRNKTEIDKVHAGLVYEMIVDDDITIKETDKLEGLWVTAKCLKENYDTCESWVQLLLDNNIITDDIPYELVAANLYMTYIRKNADYGNSYYRVFKQCGPASMFVRLFDKSYRCARLMSGEKRMVNDESVLDTIKDYATYAIMGVAALDPDVYSADTHTRVTEDMLFELAYYDKPENDVEEIDLLAMTTSMNQFSEMKDYDLAGALDVAARTAIKYVSHVMTEAARC